MLPAAEGEGWQPGGLIQPAVGFSRGRDPIYQMPAVSRNLVKAAGLVIRLLSVFKAYLWRPHSVFSKVAQRPARGSSPWATGLVQGAQPMLG